MSKNLKVSFLTLSSIILLSGCSRTEDLIGNIDPYQFISDKYKKVESVVKDTFIKEDKEEINVNQDTEEITYSQASESKEIVSKESKYKSFELPDTSTNVAVKEEKFKDKYVNFKDEPKSDLENELDFKFPKSRKYSIMEVDLKSGYDGYPFRIVEINTGDFVNGVIFSSEKNIVKTFANRQVNYSKYDYYVNVVNGVAIEFYTQSISPMKTTNMVVDSKMKFSENLITKYDGNCKDFVTNFVARNEIVGKNITKFEYKDNTFYKNSVELTINDPYLPGLQNSLNTICLDATKKLFNKN